MNNYEFQYNLDVDSAVILANIKLNDEVEEGKEEEDVFYLENPIIRINEINY